MIKNTKNNTPSFYGIVFIKTNLTLLNLAQLISEKLFCDLKFQGQNKQIREEVPAVFIKGYLMGLSIVLSGSSDTGYSLSIKDSLIIKGAKKNRINISRLLYELLKKGFSEKEEIVIVEPTPTA